MVNGQTKWIFVFECRGGGKVIGEDGKWLCGEGCGECFGCDEFEKINHLWVEMGKD